MALNDSLIQVRQTLKEYGFSVTEARRSVFVALQAHEPQTMHELIRSCASIDRASIYRTIDLFERLGIVQRLYIGWKYKLELTHNFTHHHHHLSCINCGRIINLPEDRRVEQHLRKVAQLHGFAPYDHQVEIHGLCADCQAA